MSRPRLPSIRDRSNDPHVPDLKLTIPKRYNDVQSFPSPVTPDAQLVSHTRVSRVSSVKRPGSNLSLSSMSSAGVKSSNCSSYESSNAIDGVLSGAMDAVSINTNDKNGGEPDLRDESNSDDENDKVNYGVESASTKPVDAVGVTPPLHPSPFPGGQTPEHDSMSKIISGGGSVVDKRIISEYVPTSRPTPQRGASEGSRAGSAHSGTHSGKPILHREKTSAGSAEFEYVHHVYDIKHRLGTWRELDYIGCGGFSRVMLGGPVERHVQPKYRSHCEKYLVAIKVVELNQDHGQGKSHNIMGGLLREVEILRSLSHPSIIHLLGFNMDDQHAVLVESYCCGGDLFVLAAQNRHVLTPEIVARVFGEVALAVEFLHQNNVVHRDIKLENVLLNVSLACLEQWAHSGTNPRDNRSPVAVLTDFGLSKRIDPHHPLLDTRCGSEDYVPPELLMGQSYDGRQMDTWALGVLLYAILEGQLPFDGPNDVSRRRISHRIARIDWTWTMFSEETPDWLGAMSIVEACLRRRDSRITAAEICKKPWVRDAVPDPLTNNFEIPPEDLFV